MVKPVTFTVCTGLPEPTVVAVPTLEVGLEIVGTEVPAKAQVAPIIGLSPQKSIINSCAVVTGVKVTLYWTPAALGVELLSCILRTVIWPAALALAPINIGAADATNNARAEANAAGRRKMLRLIFI
jgi:hypothetical protein